MALVGNMIATSFAGNPATVNYTMFVAVFAMVTLFYLIAIAFNESFTGHAIIPLVLDGLNVLLWFAAAVALASGLGVHSCSNGVCLSSGPAFSRRCSVLTPSTGLHSIQSHHQWLA